MPYRLSTSVLSLPFLAPFPLRGVDVPVRDFQGPGVDPATGRAATIPASDGSVPVGSRSPRP